MEPSLAALLIIQLPILDLFSLAYANFLFWDCFLQQNVNSMRVQGFLFYFVFVFAFALSQLLEEYPEHSKDSVIRWIISFFSELFLATEALCRWPRVPSVIQWP